MPMNRRKAARPQPAAAWAMHTFLCFLITLSAGCRQATPVTGPSQEIRLSLRMTEGESFVYSRWDLDEFGYPVAGTQAQHHWTVAKTGAVVQADTGITVVIESVGSQSVDTLLFRFAPGGNVYEFGFFSRISLQMGAGTIAPQWDLLAVSGLAPGQSWVAGVSDSAGADTVWGTFNSQIDYFSAVVNDTSTVFSAYQVDLNSQRVVCSNWLTDSPPCFAGNRVESTFAGNGFASYIDSVTTTHR
jgi:hypothetical protein